MTIANIRQLQNLTVDSVVGNYAEKLVIKYYSYGHSVIWISKELNIPKEKVIKIINEKFFGGRGNER